MFRRDSKYVEAIRKVLAEQHELDLPGRRLEDYSRAGLLLPKNASPEEQAAHIVAADLPHTFRPGVKAAASKATFAAAAKGTASEGFAVALHRLWGDSLPSTSVPGPGTNTGNRAMAHEVEDIVKWASAGAPGATEEMAKFVTGLMEGARQTFAGAPIPDEVTETEEPPGQSVATALECVLGLLYNDTALPSPEGVASVERAGGAPPTDAPAEEYVGPTTAADLMSTLAGPAPAVEPAVNEALDANAGELAKSAAWFRQFLAAAPPSAVVHQWVPEQLDVLAGQLAPVALAMRNAGFLEVLHDTFEELGLDAQRYLPPAP